ncbi:MAG: T9SS type A sorting domain-containing protein, partial [Bacteroidota bacterium]
KFYGDWTALLDSGYLSFDLNIDNRSNGSLLNKPYLVRLSGNGAVAEVRPPDSILNLAIDQWYTFTFLIDSSVWTMQSGTWDSLITSVQEVRLEFEFILGNERASFDNFCLVPRVSPTTRIDAWETRPVVQLAPNPAPGIFTVRSNNNPIESVKLYDLSGRQLSIDTVHSPGEVQISSQYKGMALVQIQTQDGIWRQKLLLQ